MSHYYEDSECQYNGYYSNEDDGYQSDRAESVYSDPDPAHSEYNHYEHEDNVQHHDNANYGDGMEWETEPEGLEYRDMIQSISLA